MTITPTDATTATGRTGLRIALWEFSLGVWLVAKGFKPSPVTDGMVPAGLPQEDDYGPSEAVHGPRSLPHDRFATGQLDRHRSIRLPDSLHCLLSAV